MPMRNYYQFLRLFYKNTGPRFGTLMVNPVWGLGFFSCKGRSWKRFIKSG